MATMKQAIPGVVPPGVAEATIHVIRPSMAAYPVGRFIGRMCSIQAGVGGILTVGNLMALALIPLALAIYLRNLGPWFACRYRLTNRRLILERGMTNEPERWVSLDDFDNIEIKTLPGQEWYPAGELIFRKGTIETFRLSGVRNPEAFRQVCLKAQRAHSSVKKITDKQRVPQPA